MPFENISPSSAVVTRHRPACDRLQFRSQPVVLKGAGSTFVYPVMGRWIEDFEHSMPTCGSTTSRSGAAVGLSR